MTLSVLFRKFSKNKDFAQAFSLLVTTIIGLLLGFVINSLLTRILGKVSYGDYALIYNIFTFCQVVFNFGIFYTIARLVAITNDDEKCRGYYLVGCVFIILLFVIMSVAVGFYAIFSDSLISNGLSNVLLLSIPLSWVYLITTLNENYLPSVNKINLLSFSRLLPKFLLFVALLTIFFFFENISLLTIITVNYFTFIFTYILVYRKIKPTLKNFRRRLSEILIGNKRFGFHIFAGSVIATGSGNLSALLISHFGVNNVEVGYFTLATLLASPLSMIPNIIATTQFKTFAQSSSIPKKLILVTFGLSLFMMLFIVIFSRLIVTLIFGAEYIDSVIMLQYLSIGFILYGVGDFFNRFLLAKGKGKELRNASVIVGITLLFANFIFIYWFGGEGAAIARILSGVMYTAIILYYYKKEIAK